MENELKNRHKIIYLKKICTTKILKKPITFKDGIKDINFEKKMQ